MNESSAGLGSPGLPIREVSRRTGLSEPTLRYYEEIGLIDPVARDPSSGHRSYDPTTLARIESLANLRAVGLSIDGMRTLMHARGHEPETIDTKLELLVAHSAALDQEIGKLEARQRFLQNRIAYWNAVKAGDEAACARLVDAGEVLARLLA
jgi:DNA-binding transcriptional MerR regulator